MLLYFYVIPAVHPIHSVIFTCIRLLTTFYFLLSFCLFSYKQKNVCKTTLLNKRACFLKNIPHKVHWNVTLLDLWIESVLCGAAGESEEITTMTGHVKDGIMGSGGSAVSTVLPVWRPVGMFCLFLVQFFHFAFLIFILQNTSDMTE